jgi:glycosyltransferase involved in cell wall biosynthesis
MKPTLWFVVPAHGREQLAAICLRQLRRTCDLLDRDGIEATAVVVADDDNLSTARELGFGTYRRDNRFLAKKFNDGIQAALDHRFNPRPADYVVPCGSDDWVDHRILLNLPRHNEIRAYRTAAFVDEAAGRIVSCELDNPAGVGIRIYPARLMKTCGYRPADEDRARACDTSILVNVTRACREQNRTVRIGYGDQHPWQIVDWKTTGTQLNPFGAVTSRHHHRLTGDPFETLAGIFPPEALDEMRDHHAARHEVAA